MKFLVLLIFFVSSFAQGAVLKSYSFYADTHIGSKYLGKDILPETSAVMLQENAYDLGDSFEIKNAEPSQCYAIKSAWETHKKLFVGRFVSGNHSVDRGAGPINQIIDGHILLTHGDYPLWDTKKRTEFRNEKSCQGSGFIQKMLATNNGSISNSEARELAAYAKKFKGVDTIVIGHVHPKIVFNKIVDGIRVICVPRGKSILKL